MTEFDVGENGVLKWAPPIGNILYYNVIITRPESGEMVARIEQYNDTSVDLSEYGEIGGKFNIKV